MFDVFRNYYCNPFFESFQDYYHNRSLRSVSALCISFVGPPSLRRISCIVCNIVILRCCLERAVRNGMRKELKLLVFCYSCF